MIYLDFIRWWNKYTSATVICACVRFMFATSEYEWKEERKEGRNEDDEKQQQQHQQNDKDEEKEWMNAIEFEMWLATAFFYSFSFQHNVIIFQFEETFIPFARHRVRVSVVVYWYHRWIAPKCWSITASIDVVAARA